MRKATSDTSDSFRRIFSLVPFIVSATLLVGLLPAAEPVIAEETGIKGQVLRGPAYPGPGIEGRPDEAPFRAVFHVFDSQDRKVARFESDEEGHFKVFLPPAKYTIVPDKSAPILFPQRQKREVIVPREGFADVTLRFETGLR